MKEHIIVFDVTKDTLDIYRDFAPVATRLGMTTKQLQTKLSKGVYYQKGCFVGYATLHKSGSGGKREPKQQ